MQLARPAFALHPRSFGRGQIRQLSEPEMRAGWTISGELKLFATTFIGGFVFVSILLA